MAAGASMARGAVLHGFNVFYERAGVLWTNVGFESVRTIMLMGEVRGCRRS